MSFISFRSHMILDEVAVRPKSQKLFSNVNSNTYLFSFITRTELDLFLNFLVLLLDNFDSLFLEQSDMMKLNLNFTICCIKALYIPGCYFKHSSYFNVLSSNSYIAPLKGFFD